MDYEKDFYDSLEEDVHEVFTKLKRIYGGKKNTNVSYIQNLEQILDYYGKYFD